MQESGMLLQIVLVEEYFLPVGSREMKIISTDN